MQTLLGLCKNFHHFYGLSCMRLACCFSMRSIRRSIRRSCRFLLFRVNPFWLQLCYFLVVSFLGFFLLKALDFKDPSSTPPRDIDLFFTSVSAACVSSMATVEMEVFSNAQLMVITVIMLVGGEVFLSMLECLITKAKFRRRGIIKVKPSSNIINGKDHDHFELDQYSNMGGSSPPVELELVVADKSNCQAVDHNSLPIINEADDHELRYRCVRYLCFVVLGFLLVITLGGSLLVFLYVSLVPSARDVLKKKRIERWTFSVFTTVSTFTNCGFIPTNENMIVFRKNSGLLLLFVPLILMGNTLFPSCLRCVVWVLKKVTKKVEFERLLKKPEEMGSDQLLRPLHCLLLVPTVIGFILLQVILFCSMEWHSEALSGMNSYQKIVGALFQSTNSRHTGESIVDIATLAPAVLVLCVVMMYLPPHTSFLPVSDDKKGGQVGIWLKSLVLSQLGYLCLFIILVCLTENSKMREDPINFSVLNVVIEVISAYGNVGFSTGYSCQRRLKQDGYCKDAWYGFVGRWSDAGKIILIIVMFHGRLKKFNTNGGKAWKLH